jgi:cytolysin (calcineurin-like family phosphatase)
VVDLHIEKLSNDWEHLTNAEILDIQLKEFEKWYDLALAHHQSHLLVIHGVGSGRHRAENHEAQRLKREVKSIVNQYHPSYGYGATEIYFQY